MLWWIKATLGGLAALLATAIGVVFVVNIIQKGATVERICGGIGGVGIPGLFALLLLWSAVVGDWERTDNGNRTSRSAWDWLRRPVGVGGALSHARRPEDRLPGDVVVRFTTYYGFLFIVVWQDWHVALPPEEARQALRTMLWSNLCFGSLAYGGVLVPPMTLANFWVQWRSIRRQEREALTQA
jgi:hypothetical protein